MDEHTYGVAELGAALARLLGQAFPGTTWVRGQIRNISRSANGHVYFSLAEPGPLGTSPDALLSVTLLAAERTTVNRVMVDAGAGRMADGVEVRIGGRVGWWGPGGRVQLRMTAIDPTYTLGRLEEDRARLLAVLRAEGLLDRNGLLPLPPAPRRIAVVTSVGSAAHADFLHELERAAVGLHVLEVDARVQGPDAARSVPAAIAAAVAAGAELVAVVRGGGSRTDLACFDGEGIARAIATATVPVLTGIGHEVDRHVADDVAHTAFKTPTACGAFVAGLIRAAVEHAEQRWAAIVHVAELRLDTAGERVHDRATRTARATTVGLTTAQRALRSSSERAGRAAARSLTAASDGVEARSARLALAPGARLDDAGRALDAIEARARALDPALALARGWSITRAADGRLVRAVTDVAPGDRLVTTVGRGTVHSTVDGTDDDA